MRNQKRQWLERAKCAERPREWDGYEQSEALLICGSCPVARECLSLGRRVGGYGVWGGKVLRERTPANA